MAWPKLKQYLENSWYRWASQDRQTWYAAQYQYWYWVNTRDMKNGVCLAWWKTQPAWWTLNKKFIYFVYSWDLYMFTEWWDIIDTSNWNVMVNVWKTWGFLHAITFWDYIYVCIWTYIFKVDPSWLSWSSSAVTHTFPEVSCILNYANTFLLFWSYDEVWRLDTAWILTKIRDFESWYSVYWLTQEWNYLKIYTSNWVDTKIHYAKGTFDVEDTWLVQTVSLKWLAIGAWSVTYDQWNDYVLFQVWTDYKLAKIQWYNKIDIRWTQKRWTEKVFKWEANSYYRPTITACDWVVFASMLEWVWTFTEYNWWLRWWCVEFPREDLEYITHVFRYGEQLWVCVYSDWDYIVRRYDLSFHPSTYQSNWFIIGRVFDWWCAWLFKKNDQATITYNMPVGTSMELSYRYDRSSFGYDKSNFLSIKNLTDTTNCYDIVVPTTPWMNAWSVLLMENNADEILLENWNWIELEELMVCPFNKTWNLLEYRFDLSTTDSTKTPILFEHSLTYYDYMRKYR